MDGLRREGRYCIPSFTPALRIPEPRATLMAPTGTPTDVHGDPDAPSSSSLPSSSTMCLPLLLVRPGRCALHSSRPTERVCLLSRIAREPLLSFPAPKLPYCPSPAHRPSSTLNIQAPLQSIGPPFPSPSFDTPPRCLIKTIPTHPHHSSHIPFSFCLFLFTALSGTT